MLQSTNYENSNVTHRAVLLNKCLIINIGSSPVCWFAGWMLYRESAERCAWGAEAVRVPHAQREPGPRRVDAREVGAVPQPQRGQAAELGREARHDLLVEVLHRH